MDGYTITALVWCIALISIALLIGFKYLVTTPQQTYTFDD